MPNEEEKKSAFVLIVITELPLHRELTTQKLKGRNDFFSRSISFVPLCGGSCSLLRDVAAGSAAAATAADFCKVL